MKKLTLIILFILMAGGKEVDARKYSISTNLLGYVQLGTMNLDCSLAVARRTTLDAGIRYNPFVFYKDDPTKQFQCRQQSCSLGFRYWPWHAYSGWWFSGKLRYQEYSTGGLSKPYLWEGDRMGGGIYCGYSHMLSSHLNMEFGVGCWMGMDVYNKYECVYCGPFVDSGRDVFVRPDDIMISLVYVF